ncbi:MAG: serine/threonine-protein kinase [Myxococcota bacterium]
MLGRYSVVGPLATGGMAEILLARLEGPGGFRRPVVIKRMLPHLARDPVFIELFLDEARIAAGVRHPNVVQVQELHHQGDELFLVMEYLEGESVVALLRALSERGIAVPIPVACFIAAECCAGLRAAHELVDESGRPLHLVHRDVSPDNIFLTYDGVVKLLDFGIAKARDRLAHTRTGHVRGKAAYMSPEQILGEPLDHRSDLFSLGVVLYELLTGRRLFTGDNDLALAKAICEGPIAPPRSLRPEISMPLESVLLRALEKRRGDRFESAGDLRAALSLAVPEALHQGAALAALVQRSFPAAVEGKRAMLAELAEDRLGPATQAIVQGAATAPMRARAPRRWPAALAGGMLVAGVGAAAVLLRPATVDPPPPVVRPAALVTPSPSSMDKVEALVTVEIRSLPEGARVILDGEDRGLTPVQLRLPQGERALALELSREGYQTLRWSLSPSRDLALQLSLVKASAAPKPAARPTPKPKKAPDRDFHRFD